jgi:hypothetical protein
MTTIPRADINDIADHLSRTGVSVTIYPPHADFDDHVGSLSFRPKDSDAEELLEWNNDHGWTLCSQCEPSPPVTVKLAVAEPATAFLVASAVIAVYTGAVDEFETISYGDIRYAS